MAGTPRPTLHIGIWHTILPNMRRGSRRSERRSNGARRPRQDASWQPGDSIDEEILRTLSEVSTATITTQLLQRGLRNTFLHGLSPLNPQASRIVGPAFTLRYIPAREDIDVVESFQDPDHPQRQAVEAAPPGSVLVMDCRLNGRAASAGHILATRLAHRGVAGLVTDGSVRDSTRISMMDLPVFVQSVSAMTNLALHHAVDFDVPIGCAGVAVFPGDIIVADGEGVVCIPRHLATQIAQPCAHQESLEEFLLQRVRDGAALPGTYPPDEQTLAAYGSRR